MLRVSSILVLLFFAGIPNRSVQYRYPPIRLQQLIGVWQEGDSLLTSGWQDAYAFFPNGTFDFYFSQYNYTKRIISLHGHYRLSPGILSTEIDSRTELVGGHVERGDPQIEGEWEIAGYHLEVIKQKPKWQNISIWNCKKPASTPCFELQGLKFYKISSDPNYYRLNH